MTLLSWLLFLGPALFGVGLAGYVRLASERVLAVLLGIVVGLVSTTSLLLVLMIATGLPGWLLWLVVLGLLVGGGWLVWQARGWWRSVSYDWWAVAVAGLSLALFAVIAPKLLLRTPDGLATGVINAYGDVAWHAAIVMQLARDASWPPDNPIYAGTQLTYPFLVDFFSSVLVRTGADLVASLTWPAVFFIPLLLTLLYSVVREVSGRRAAGIVAVLLFLFGGATLGWLRLPGDWLTSETSLVDFLLHLPARDYYGVGTDPDGWHFLNPVTTLLLPQRSLLLGLPLAVTLVWLVLPPHQKAWHESAIKQSSDEAFGAGLRLRKKWPTLAGGGSQDVRQRREVLLLAGVLAGLLPLIHAHSVIVVAAAVVALFVADLIRDRRKWWGVVQQWLWFVVPALAVGMPQVWYFVTGLRGHESFIRFEPGWLVGEHNVLWYWFKNTGLLLPLSVLGLWLPAPRRAKVLAVAGLVLFAIANVWLFAPWAWDNYKLLVYWLIWALPLLGWMAWWAWQRWPVWPARAVVVLLVGVHLLSAVFDVTKVALPTAAVWGEWGETDIALAEQMRETVPAGAVVVTAPTHNSPVVLAGQPRYLGFSGHVWSHGLDLATRERAVREFYEGKRDDLPGAAVSYVLVGPQERREYPGLIVRDSWRPAVVVGEYVLYRR